MESRKIINLHEKQGEAFELLTDSSKRFIFFGGGSTGGKSWLGWVWLLSMCFKFAETRWFIGRDELKRLRNTTLVTFFKVLAAYQIPDNYFNYNAQDHFIQFINGSRIDLLELKYYPSDPLFQRFGSAEYTGGWIEEAGEVNFGSFDMLKSRVNRHLNMQYGLKPAKILLTFNPQKNWLYETVYMPFRESRLPADYVLIQSLYYHNIFREEGTDEQLESITNEAQKQRLKYGNWEYADDPDVLIQYTDLMNIKDVPIKRGLNYAGVDVARMGDDKTTFVKFEGNYLAKIKTFSKIDTAETAIKLINFMKADAIAAENIGIDTVGLGAGTYDFMKSRGVKCIEIISGAKPTRSTKTYEFKNLRSQMYWQFREDVLDGNIRIDMHDQELLTDLSAVRYKIVMEKVIQIEPKDDIKSRLGRSPDKGDAVVYANAIRSGILKRVQKFTYTSA
jgi:hypothetical protein